MTILLQDLCLLNINNKKGLDKMIGEFFGMDNLDLPQAMFMAEEEGMTDMVNTRKAKINAITNALDRLKREDPFVNTMDFIDNIIEKESLDIGTLTLQERSIIDRHT